MKGILVYFHCGSNTGYAIESLEKAFYQMSRNIVSTDDRIHFGYADLDKGFPRTLPAGFSNVIQFDSSDSSKESLKFIGNYVRDNQIEIAFGFDQPLSRPGYRTMKQAGLKKLISYWGAPMSSINPRWKLFLKQMEVRMKRYKPDHYIFESKAMADTAVYGRGIHPKDVSIVYLGVDIEKYNPDAGTYYAHDVFGIPRERRIVVYSGHMEERKGVHVIINAAINLIVEHGRNDVHFLLMGNKDGEEKRFEHMYHGTRTEQYVTFGGYRNDINRIFPSCFVGTIASTGWDSFTMSSLEMAASGLPLIVSDLQGLVETVEDKVTGSIFERGNHVDLARKIQALLDDQKLWESMSERSRERILSGFTADIQIKRLTSVLTDVCRK